MSKLKNIKAVRELLDGRHKTQTRKSFGFSDTAATAEKNKKREIGEKWTEIDSNNNEFEWEQKDGYRVKVAKNLNEAVSDVREYLFRFPKCPNEVCTCTNPTNLDKKFKKLTGMCEDCIITIETRMKMQGKFDSYAKNKMKLNAESFFKEADVEIQVVKSAFSDLNFVANADGLIEKWEMEGNIPDKIQEEYNNFKQKVMEKFK